MLNALLFALMLFVMRIINNTISTLNIIAIVRQQRWQSFILTFFESLIWAVVIANVIEDLSDWQNPENLLKLFAYSAGFAAGNFTGMWVENRLVTNYVNVTITLREQAHTLCDQLRQCGYGVTLTSGEGRDGLVHVLHSIILRRDLPDMLDIACQIDPQAFVSVDPVRMIEHGWIHRN